MSKYRVPVWREITEHGYLEIEAFDESDAFDKAHDLLDVEMDEEVEWGSCGDITNYFVDRFDLVEKVHEPSVSDGLWK